MRIHDVISVNDASQLLDLFGRAIRDGESFVTESKTVLADGTHVWIKSTVAAIFDQSGVVQRLVAVAEDVTVRRDAEDNLVREHQKLLNTVRERTATLKEAREVIHAEIEQRKHVEAALVQDFAERRKAQEALTESERRFRLFIQGVSARWNE